MSNFEKSEKFNVRVELLKNMELMVKSLEDEIVLFLNSDKSERVSHIIKIKELIKGASNFIIGGKSITYLDEKDREVILSYLDRFSRMNHLFIKETEKGG